MTTVRQVRDKFQDLISHLQKVKSALEAESSATVKEAEQIKSNLAEAIAVAVPDLKPETIAKLDQAADAAKTDRSFSKIIAGFELVDTQHQEQITKLQNQYVSPEADIAVRNKEQALQNEMQARLNQTNDDMHQIQKAQKAILKHNDQYYYENAISKENAADFKKLRPLRYCIDSSYRSAYEAMRDYQPVNGSFENDAAKLEELSTQKNKQAEELLDQEQKVSDLNKSIDAMGKLDQQIKGLRKLIKSPEDKLEIIHDAILELVKENEAFANNLAANMGLELGSPLALAALKMLSLEKSDTKLQAQIAGIDKTISKLKNPMAKLNRGVNRGASRKNMKIDLDSIETAVDGQVAAVGKFATNATNFRNSVSAYQPAYHSSNDLFFANYILLYYLLTQNTDNADRAYTCHAMDMAPSQAMQQAPAVDTANHQSIGGGTGEWQPAPTLEQSPDAHAPNVDPGIPLDPEHDVVEPNVHDVDPQGLNFDSQNIEIPDAQIPDLQIDTSIPDVDVSVPDVQVDVPDIEVPDIEVPDVEVDMPDMESDTGGDFGGGDSGGGSCDP